MNIWLDDERDPYHFTQGVEWKWVKNPRQFWTAWFSGPVELISFDNDLGDTNCQEGVDILTELERMHNGEPFPFEVKIHTANPVARDKMNAILDRIDERNTA